MKAREVTDLQRRIRPHRSLRSVALGGCIGSAFVLVVDLVSLPRAAWIPAVMLALAVLLAVQETRVLGRLRAQPETMPAERPKTHAEQVAEAVEAQRQRQWDAIAERAYLAAGGAGQVSRKGAFVRPENGLPPGFVPPSAALGSPLRSMGSMADFATGMGRLSAPLGPCAHLNAEPVDLITGERVAWLCPDCPAELPADWR